MPSTETAADDATGSTGGSGQAMRSCNQRITDGKALREAVPRLAAMKAGRVKALIEAHP